MNMSPAEQETVVDEDERRLLLEILDQYRARSERPDFNDFRVTHVNERSLLDRLRSNGFIKLDGNKYGLTLAGLRACGSEQARITYARCEELLGGLQQAYLKAQTRSWTVEEFSRFLAWSADEVQRIITLLTEVPGLSVHQISMATGFVAAFSLIESVLDVELPPWPEEPDSEGGANEAAAEPKVEYVEISGYRIFENFEAPFGNPTVIIGPNGSGKSSLLDLLRFLAFAVDNPLPPEIDPQSAGKMLFHAGGPEKLDLAVVVSMGGKQPLRYELTVLGPLGAPRVARERLVTIRPLSEDQSNPFIFLSFTNGKGVVNNPRQRTLNRPAWTVQPNELALRRALDPTLATLPRFQRFVSSWRFYTGFDVSSKAAVRRATFIEEDPILAEDGSNLSAVLFALMAESKSSWEELETHLRSSIQGFMSLNVKPRGKGMVMATWREEGLKDELTLADMSDGSLRTLCWLALALSPHLPPLICIDEPETGLHPSVLPTLAGVFKIASARTQLIITTHSPHFLSQFSLDQIVVMRKEQGRAVFVRPATSAVLRNEVERFGGEAIARMFITEELEALP